MTAVKNDQWSKLSYEGKNLELIAQELETLELFLEKKAITKEDYDKAMNELKQGIVAEKNIPGEKHFTEAE